MAAAENKSSNKEEMDKLYWSLVMALRNDNRELAHSLLKEGAPVNNDRRGPYPSPLYYAITLGNIEMVRMLLERKADIYFINEYDDQPFNAALKQNTIPILKLFGEFAVNCTYITSKDFIRLLHFMMKKKTMRSSAENLMANRPAHIDFDQVPRIERTFHAACIYGYLSFVRIFLDSGVNINAVGKFKSTKAWKTALGLACEYGHHEIVEFLLDKGAELDVEGTSIPLHLACRSGNQDIVELLVQKGVDVNIKDANGRAAVDIAAENGRVDVVVYLLKFENLELKFDQIKSIIADSTGKNKPMIIESIFSYLEKLSWENCLKNGIDGSVIENLMKLPLIYKAAGFGHVDCISILVKFGFDINYKNREGKTPLHQASADCNHKFILRLLQYGGDISVTCDQGKTPFDYVVKKKPEGTMNRRIFYRLVQDNESRLIKYDINIVTTFAQYFIKMKLLKLDVNENNYRDAIENSKTPLKKIKKYEQEVERMKNKFINNVSFYDIARAMPNQMILYLERDAVFETLKSEKYRSEFPEYADVIKGNFERGHVRRRLLDEADKLAIFDDIRSLPYYCMKKILKHFTNVDLQVLIYRHKWCRNCKHDKAVDVDKSFKNYATVHRHNRLK
ncbi:serine/threonine-protein phosphatase 6 regulatory ankyrin repeat subunit B-like [Microplitis mediator]|uniref:serine/threonine-protein phosphatase 6 regulatory ankyrin repeat subunit B-like n=1 Tax=Microplitis mediator TaxID=375433 RepID=UPI00255319A0|nr:serine/threonine-protein phosphatase 6 regulatory ankyrin repeat subunit B-like [Microplitis mediator]